MATCFTIFPLLPTEIRLIIWQHALPEWTITAFHRVNGRIKMVGALGRGVSQACRESHEVMAKQSTHVEPYGWIRFTHHLFIIRDARSEQNMLMDIDEQFDFCRHIQMATIQGRDWPFYPETLRYLQRQFHSLRKLVIIHHWPNPDDTPLELNAQLYIVMPCEDRRPLFDFSPSNIDFSLLLDHLCTPSKNLAEYNTYRGKLDAVKEFSLRHPEILPAQNEGDHPLLRTRLILQRVEEWKRAMAPRKVDVYLRKRSQLMFLSPTAGPSPLFGPMEDDDDEQAVEYAEQAEGRPIGPYI